MVDLKEYEQTYAVHSLKQKVDDSSLFVSIQDEVNTNLPPIDVHFVNGSIYAVKFMNNDFFEVEETVLLNAIDCLLAGEYRTKKSLFGKNSIVLQDKSGVAIAPERVYSDGEFKEIYKDLPKRFTLR